MNRISFKQAAIEESLSLTLKKQLESKDSLSKPIRLKVNHFKSGSLSFKTMGRGESGDDDPISEHIVI